MLIMKKVTGAAKLMAANSLVPMRLINQVSTAVNKNMKNIPKIMGIVMRIKTGERGSFRISFEVIRIIRLVRGKRHILLQYGHNSYF